MSELRGMRHKGKWEWRYLSDAKLRVIDKIACHVRWRRAARLFAAKYPDVSNKAQWVLASDRCNCRACWQRRNP